MLTERGRRFLEHYLQLQVRPCGSGITVDDLLPVVRKLDAAIRRLSEGDLNVEVAAELRAVREALAGRERGELP